MDAVDILRICLRRWYVMVPFLLGAAGVSYQLVTSQETTYTAAASYGLVQPQLPGGSGSEAERNPLGPDGNALVGAALEAQLSSRQTQEELGGGDTRGWGPGEATNGSYYSVGIPMFETTYEVRAWGEDEEAVRAVVDRVIKAAPGITEDLQTRAGVPNSGRYEPFVLAPTQSEALASTSGMKLVIAVMGVGVLVGAAWSIVADRVLRRRTPAPQRVPVPHTLSGQRLPSGQRGPTAPGRPSGERDPVATRGPVAQRGPRAPRGPDDRRDQARDGDPDDERAGSSGSSWTRPRRMHRSVGAEQSSTRR